MWERASICLLAEIDWTMFLLFPWQSFTDFWGMKFFYLQVSGDLSASTCWTLFWWGVLPLALGYQHKAHISKSIWLAGSGGRHLFFIDSVQLVQRHKGSQMCTTGWKEQGVPVWILRAGQQSSALCDDFPCCPCACWPPPLGSTSGCWPLLLQCALWSAICTIFYAIPE